MPQPATKHVLWWSWKIFILHLGSTWTITSVFMHASMVDTYIHTCYNQNENKSSHLLTVNYCSVTQLVKMKREQ